MNPLSPKAEIKPKSILVKKKAPKLVHTPASQDAGEAEPQGPTIYAQSATDISEDDSERQRKASIPLTINTKARFLDVPQNPEAEQQQQQSTNGKLRKSKSFASSGSGEAGMTGQYEYAMKDSEISAKQKTIMAFFDASLTSGNSNNSGGGNVNPQRQSMFSPPLMAQTGQSKQPIGTNLANPNQLQQVKQSADSLQSAVVKRSSAVAIHAKRGSITSISDEIIGDEDLKDVDAVFESLLNSTFQEIQARGRSAEGSDRSKKKRSVSVHPTSRVSFSSSVAESNVGNVSRSAAVTSPGATVAAVAAQTAAQAAALAAALAAEGRDLKSSSTTTGTLAGPKRGTVNRKQSKHKLVAGEVKSAVIVNNSDPSNSNQIQTGSGSNNSTGNGNMPNKEILADPLGALPTSHTKKYLPRQQTWAGHPTSVSAGSSNISPNFSSNPNLLPHPIPTQTPSPTQSEYDTCPDPWEDY